MIRFLVPTFFLFVLFISCQDDKKLIKPLDEGSRLIKHDVGMLKDTSTLLSLSSGSIVSNTSTTVRHLTDEKYVFGEVAISANSTEKEGVLKMYTNYIEGDYEHSLLRGFRYTYDPGQGILNRFQKVAFKVNQIGNANPYVYDISLEPDTIINRSERYFDTYTLPPVLPYDFNLHVEGPELLWHKKLHLQNGLIDEYFNNGLASVKVAKEGSDNYFPIVMRLEDIRLLSLDMNYSPITVGCDPVHGDIYQLTKDHSHFHDRYQQDQQLNPIYLASIINGSLSSINVLNNTEFPSVQPKDSIEASMMAPKPTKPCEKYQTCYDWDYTKHMSLLFYIDNTNRDTFLIDTFYDCGTKICIDQDVENLDYFFILPYNGKVFVSDTLINQSVALELAPSHDVRIVGSDTYEGDIASSLTNTNVNDMLKNIYSGFRINLTDPVDVDLDVTEATTKVDVENILIDFVNESDSNIDHNIVPNSAVLNKYYPAAEGAYVKLNDDKNFYLGEDDLLTNEYLLLHELCHISLVDAQDTLLLTTISGSEIKVKNIMMADNEDREYCNYGITYKDMFLLQEMNPRFAPEGVMFFEDERQSCGINFEEVFIMQTLRMVLNCNSPACIKLNEVNTNLLSYNLENSLKLHTVNLFGNALLIGEASSSKHIQKYYNEQTIGAQKRILQELNLVLGKKYSYSEYNSLTKEVKEDIVTDFNQKLQAQSRKK